MRISFRIAAASVALQLRILKMISPGTVLIVAPVFKEIKPRREETLTPAEAFERHQVPPPADLGTQLLAR